MPSFSGSRRRTNTTTRHVPARWGPPPTVITKRPCVADNGSDMFVQGTMDARWDNDLLNPAFHALDAADFEVIELGWRP